MNVQIFEKPTELLDITLNSMPAISDVWVATNSAQIAVLQSYLAKLNRTITVTGMFDQNTFKGLVGCVNKRNGNSEADPIYLSYPDVPAEVLARESGVYLQRTVRFISNNPIDCDGKIGIETIGVLNTLLCDTVLAETGSEPYHDIWLG